MCRYQIRGPRAARRQVETSAPRAQPCVSDSYRETDAGLQLRRLNFRHFGGHAAAIRIDVVCADRLMAASSSSASRFLLSIGPWQIYPVFAFQC